VTRTRPNRLFCQAKLFRARQLTVAYTLPQYNMRPEQLAKGGRSGKPRRNQVPRLISTSLDVRAGALIGARAGRAE
jgi:hypothetical protein